MTESSLVNKLAQMSSISYATLPIAEQQYKNLGYSHVKYVDYEGAQCYIVWNTDEMVICFRGTEPRNWSDIKADLRAWLIKDERIAPCLSGRVHKGFYFELKKIIDRIYISIEQMRHNKKLYLTGHSLGGAIATIASGKIENVDLLCTFGAPRVGTRKYIKNIKCKHLRFVNNNDVVPSVPPSLLFYKHHGDLVYINHYGNIRKMTPWQRIKDQFRGRWAALKKKMPFDGIYDHGINYYIRYTKEKLLDVGNDNNNDRKDGNR